MADPNGSDDSSVIDIDDAAPYVPPPKYQHKRLNPPSARAILELGDRDFRTPPAPEVKCHILGIMGKETSAKAMPKKAAAKAMPKKAAAKAMPKKAAAKQ
jgi:hypothetical protein